MNTAQIILTLTQIIILTYQLHLTWKIKMMERRQNIGYFVLKESNINHNIRYGNDTISCKNVYDFNKPLTFELSGNSDVFVLGKDIYIDNNQMVNGNKLLETLFTINNTRRNKLRIDNFKELQNRMIGTKNVEIVLHLKLIDGLKYKEKIKLRFEENNDNPEKYWILDIFNITFEF